ncbi:hypothetical protein EDD16DRAFT_1517228 [Pisolithus croceorrhizus]|nr:hypothetical protein EDD16DRAFT_1517228 [Pisolithus croceorrhizus]
MRKGEVTVVKQAGVQLQDVGVAKYVAFEAEGLRIRKRCGEFSGMNVTETHCNHFKCLGIIKMEFKPRTEEHTFRQTHGRKGTGGLPSSERLAGELQQRDTGMASLAPPLSIRVIMNDDRRHRVFPTLTVKARDRNWACEFQ